MRIILLILCFYLISCGTNREENITSIIKSDTIQLKEIAVIQFKKNKRLLSLTTLSGDTIVKSADYYLNAAYSDINDDGYEDIRIAVISKTPNQSENYLYNYQSKEFQQLGNSDLDIKKLKNTQLYFSYNSTGCSDMNWESHLSKIENLNEVPIGYINVKGCGNEDDGIYIYKTVGNKNTLLNIIPIDSLNNPGLDKWSFIEHYWQSNYAKFN